MPTVASPLPDLVLYGRPGCHLCDEARAAIELALADRITRALAVPTFREIDIEMDPALHRTYFERIPVVEIGDRRLELIVTTSKLRRLLSDVLDTAPERA
jgi:glutaredoxin